MHRGRFVILFFVVLFTFGQAFAKPLGQATNLTSILEKSSNEESSNEESSNEESSNSVGEVIAIAKDLDGFIWIAGSNGIARRENSQLRRYKNDPHDHDSIPANNISDLFVDSYGELWATTQGGGILRYQRHVDKFKAYQHDPDNSYSPLSNEYHDIYQGGNGNLWFAGHRGILKYDRDQDGFVRFLDKPPLNNLDFRSIVQVDDDRFLLETDSAGLFIWNYRNSTFEAVHNSNTEAILPISSVLDRIKNQDGRILIGRTNDPSELLLKTTSFKSLAAPGSSSWSSRMSSWWAYTIYFIVFVIVFVFVIGTFVKLRWQKVAEKERINLKLQELDRLRNQFIANTSHELRTPINGIIGLSEFLMAGGEGPISESMHESLSHIAQSGHRLSYHVEAFLHYSNLENDTVQMNIRSTSVQRLMKDALHACDLQSLDDQVFINNELPTDLPKVLADGRKLKHCFYQLISNAIKFTREGKITLTAQVNTETLKVQIIDTGIGISAQKLDEVFAHFKQIASSGIRTQSGTGLGLAITKQLIEQQQGQITIDSMPHRGTTVSITLPRDPQDSSATETPSFTTTHETTPPLKKPQATKLSNASIDVFEPHGSQDSEQMAHVLVVDDETVNRMVLRHRLLNLNCKVYEASNGNEALGVIASGMHFDLILLDIMMPELTGIEVCKQLRQSFPPEQLPIIFVSAKVQDKDVQEGFEAGGNDYIKKPVVNTELEIKIASFVNQD